MDISELAHHGPENVLISLISVVASFVYLFSIHPYLTLIVFACVPFLVLVAMLMRKKMTNAFMKSRVSVAQINASLESSISGIRVTKAFTNAHKEQEKFEVGNEEFVNARRDAYRAMGQFHSATTFITDVFNVVVLIAGGLFLYDGQILIGDYSSFVVSVGLFISPIMTMINFMELYQNGATGFSRFVEILDAEPEVDVPNALEVGRLDGHIELRGVTYSYETTAEDDTTAPERHVLENVSLDIEKGKTYALVGPSGGGKTTICHLIPRFYALGEGSIQIDGVDIRQMSMASLRRNIGIVQQDIYLFNASIRDNILYGRLDATQEEVEEAAKRANIHDYIMSLDEGYDTVIGERGVRLSGGQKQRLSIARVFLKNPPILILDEATSALDNTTEILIQQSLDELCRGRTTLVVAHRLSTIKNADRIAVIAQGKIVESGTHAELIDQAGMYADLYKLQFRAEDLA
jgi:ATP-binding cassette subfamily B protein